MIFKEYNEISSKSTKIDDETTGDGTCQEQTDFDDLDIYNEV